MFVSPPPPTQLGQLEVAIREHKQEMLRKVESLQQSLDVRERELRDAQRELADSNSKVRPCHETRGRNVVFLLKDWLLLCKNAK